MLFSILIPVYNVEKYLRECLDSVLQQTFDDYELILVNDGSKDSSGAICDEYMSKRREKIRVFHQENQGVLLTRRRALSEARGDYIVWLDSDDKLDARTLEKLAAVIFESQGDIIIYGYALTDEIGKSIIKTVIPLSEVQEKVFEGERKKIIYECMVAGKHMNELCTKCIKRSIIDIQADYKQWKHVRMGDDLFCLFPIVDRARKILCLNEIFYYYRTVPQSITHKPNLDYYDSYITVYERMDAYIGCWNLDNTIVKKAKQKQIQRLCEIMMMAYYDAVRDNKKIFRDFIEKLNKDVRVIKLYSDVKASQLSFPYRYYWGLMIKGNYRLLWFYIKMLNFLSKIKTSCKEM